MPVSRTSRDLTRSAAEADAARRLLARGQGSSTLDQLADLAARLLGTAAAQVSLLTDVQTIAAGAGLPPGAVGAHGPLEDSLCTVTAVGRTPLVVPDARADVRVADLPPVTSGAVVSYLGAPLVATQGDVVGALCVFDPEPRGWSDADVLLLEQLAAAAAAELERAALAGEYEASQTWWELAVDAAGIGRWEWDLRTGVLSWDERLQEIFGVSDGAFDGTFEAFRSRVHPDDLPRVLAALDRAVATAGEYEAQYRIIRPAGGIRWVHARGRALADDEGTTVRALGAAYDTTAVREGEARLTQVLESMPAGFVHLDGEWRCTYVNAEGERVLGTSRHDMLGRTLWEIFPDLTGTDAEAGYRRAVATGAPVAFDTYYPAPLDAWYEVRAWPDDAGLSVYFLDVTARRAAQAQAEVAARRSALLAEVTASLASTLDTEEAVARLARLVVPDLADWCLVSAAGDERDPWRGMRDIGSWHGQPELREVVERYGRLRLPAMRGESYPRRALTTGEPVVVPTQAAEAIAATLSSREAGEPLRRLAPESAVFLPLRARGRTLGLLSLYSDDGRHLSDALLDAAGEVAARAGLALENARLYAQQRNIAEGLQRALLTAPPEPDDLEVVVRYEPAAQLARVGGDWYDAFLQPSGATVLVIGDVVGHDITAAAAMGQLRSLLRGIAATTGAAPAEVLTRLDEAMKVLRVDTTATAVVARLEQTPEEKERAVTRLRWSNAGHPPPLAVHPDGTVEVLTGSRTNLLLGIDARAVRTDHEVELQRGSTVLLYTDGLVERRAQSLDQGLAKLRGAVAELAGRSLDDLCDDLLAKMLPERATDDVALAAVRLHPQE